ncbi:hypothetical protein DEDE109153_00760 [Deinococcus deserti]|uniref:Nudix hydrolase domain-containing protein n=1 Tax=Deinococcus deserti (strain DSM 17065 / CIP 109153 / LMG 22923 / VCD115) TaxID=546414 RepID=C1CVT5_DEIDV|nr:hypothetical protein [Deinococcus deserti]ACO46302.1 Hypothetical protein Deide_13620 [Deinococcus deserti VCD115]
MFRRKQTFYVNARAIIEGEAKKLRFPGRHPKAFDSIPGDLRREVYEETGLTVTRFLSPVNETRGSTPEGDVGCLHSSFVYQTLWGRIDGIGSFRVHAERHKWIGLRQRFEQRPDYFSGRMHETMTHDSRLQEVRI